MKFQFKLYRNNGNGPEYRKHFFVDQYGGVWIKSDPDGIDMSGMKVIKAPETFQLKLEPIKE